jgi:hypothetical protein
MQVLQVGSEKLLLLELEAGVLSGIATQLGYAVRQIDETTRVVSMELRAEDREAPLLLFDAADPGNLGWFSRCHFYVDGATGAVLQTPVRLANVRDAAGRVRADGIRMQIAKELPAKYRIPGKQPLNEHAIYAIVYNLLGALLEVGVAVCGAGVVKPLSGRSQTVRSRT